MEALAVEMTVRQCILTAGRGVIQGFSTLELKYSITMVKAFVGSRRKKESQQPVYVWAPDQRMRTLLQDFQKRALAAGK